MTGAQTPPPAERPTLTSDDVLDDVFKDPAAAVSLAVKRENVRTFVAKFLLFTLAATLIAGFALVAAAPVTHVSVADVKSFFEIVFTPIVTLVSAATGFYFGANRDSDPDDPVV